MRIKMKYFKIKDCWKFIALSIILFYFASEGNFNHIFPFILGVFGTFLAMAGAVKMYDEEF